MKTSIEVDDALFRGARQEDERREQDSYRFPDAHVAKGGLREGVSTEDLIEAIRQSGHVQPFPTSME